ncbi:NADH-quinone oxidoreductase subunit C [Paenibacillus aquistagni]|uniref:NADH-quinone oxidoreductase subunit C n=1 Tax=Paenibacillus aquistagni TaxID=1852522 RepID=UPI0030B8AB66
MSEDKNQREEKDHKQEQEQEQEQGHKQEQKSEPSSTPHEPSHEPLQQEAISSSTQDVHSQAISQEEKVETAALHETANQEQKQTPPKPPANATDTEAAKDKSKNDTKATPTPTGSAKERPVKPPRAAKSAEAVPEEPSPFQPLLDQLLEDIKREVAESAVQSSSINQKNGHLITLVVACEHWLRLAEWLKHDPAWQCNYLRNLSGVDQESYLEVVYHLIGLSTRREVAIHVRADRDSPSIPSVTSLWEAANWNEREVYDLFGIHFSDHPNLTRIMMPDQWVGHPLRKDYEPLDSEV